MKLNEKEKEILKKALDLQKFVVNIAIKGNSDKRKKEEAINDLYNIESVEKKLKG